MQRIVLALALIASVAVPAGAQGPRNSQGIPPGQLPPAGSCRVWYDGVAPGQQPRPTNCRDAERIAALDRRARVIYGSESVRAGQAPQPRAIPRTIPRRVPSDSQPYPNGRQVYRNDAFDNGYQDGYDKGREDARDNDRYDPARHGRFRSADRGYERRYGSKAEYQRTYRDGFRAAYDEGYRDYDRISRNDRRPGSRIPWPF